MFPVDSLPPQYCEERAAAEAARRLAEQQKRGPEANEMKAPVATQQASPGGLAQPLQPLSRPASSSVLGTIYQGLLKRAASGTPSPMHSAVPSRTNTPALPSSAGKVTVDVEAKLAARDVDICALPGWH